MIGRATKRPLIRQRQTGRAVSAMIVAGAIRGTRHAYAASGLFAALDRSEMAFRQSCGRLCRPAWSAADAVWDRNALWEDPRMRRGKPEQLQQTEANLAALRDALLRGRGALFRGGQRLPRLGDRRDQPHASISPNVSVFEAPTCGDQLSTEVARLGAQSARGKITKRPSPTRTFRPRRQLPPHAWARHTGCAA